jgi:hypothetical protein
LATTSATVGAAGGTVAVGVTVAAGCTWTVTSNAAWITRTSPASGTGSFLLALTVAANSGGPRTGTVSVGGVAFTVNQDGNCTYDVKPTRFRNVDEDGRTGLRVDVSAPAGCAWTATSQAPWITITSGASGTGPGTVVFSVAANTADKRSGTLTVAGRTVVVDQDDD